MKTSDSTQTDFLSAIMSLIIFQIFGVFSILGWLYQYNFGEITSGTDQNEFARLHFEKVTVTYNSTPKLFEMALRRADEIIAEFNQFCTIYTFTESRGLCCAWSQLSKGLGDNRQVTTPLNLARWIQLAPTMISAQSTTINEEQDWIVQITADDCGESLGKKRKRKSQQKKSTSDLVALIDGRLKRFADAANDYPGDWDDLDRLAISRLPDYHQHIYPSAEATSCLPVCDTIDEAVSTLRNAFADKTVHYQRLEAKDAEYLSAADDLFIPQLVSGVKKCIGIDLHSQLYAHQTQAISGVLREDKNVVVATSTSSGKSLIFHLPIIQTIIESSAPVCALYIFPTKALAQDQLGKLRLLLWECGLQDSVHADIYDGDTPANERQRIRQKCQIIFTNPDMLHAAILPNHTSWLAFLKHLRFIVVDEIHVYSGTFGSNFAFVIRRLQRLLAGISPRQEDGLQWILCSATVSNPTEHSRQLFNLPAVEEDSLLTISSDGSPRQTKDFLVWRTDSLLADSARLLIWLAECRMKTIAFCCTRKTCELLMNEVTQQLAASHTGDHLIDRIKSYRGGYRVELRREIERMLFNGQLYCVVATNALELGIDVGEIDVTMHLGFPGSLASFWQQAGRAGRRQRGSMTILLLDPSGSYGTSAASSTDAYYCTNPGALFRPHFEAVPLNTGPSPTLYRQLQCAASEQPIHVENDQRYFADEELPRICQQHLQSVPGAPQYFVCRPEFLPHPPAHFSIRNTVDAEHQVRVYLGTEVLEEMDIARALYTVYQDAIYIHEGLKFIVRVVNLSQCSPPLMVRVEPVTGIDWITEPRDITRLMPGKTQMAVCLGNDSAHCNFGLLTIATTLRGYKKLDQKTRRLLAIHELPPTTHEQTHEGLWIEVPPSIAQAMMQQTKSSISGALAAVAKAILGLLPMYVLCSSADVGIYWPRNDSELPLRMAVYDKTSSGGFTRAAFPRIREILQNLLFMANDNCFSAAKDENVKILLLSRFLLGQQPKK